MNKISLDDLMSDVVDKLVAITVHFRECNLIESSNKISKNANEILSIFSATSAQLEPQDKFLLAEKLIRDGTVTSSDNGISNRGGTSDISDGCAQDTEAAFKRATLNDDMERRNAGALAQHARNGLGIEATSGNARSFGISRGPSPFGMPTAGEPEIKPLDTQGKGPGGRNIRGPFKSTTIGTPFAAASAAYNSPFRGSPPGFGTPTAGGSDMGRNSMRTPSLGGPNHGGNLVGNHQPERAVYPESSIKQTVAKVPAVPTGLIQPEETNEERAAVMIVSGNFAVGSLNNLTSKIREGPISSIDISYSEGLARIVFLRAAHAFALVASDADLVAKRGYGRFGPGYSISRTDIHDWDASIRQMENSPKERRRLTFARGGLLGPHLPFAKFENDVKSVAGKDNIDFIWAFNSGNVTAVFNSVDVARRVLRQFVEWSNQPGQYKGVQVTFSTDPCERALVLTHQQGSQGPRTGPRSHNNPLGAGRRVSLPVGNYRRR